jgi:drug/metabolite transporter (DMT)-like permease
MSVVAPVSGLVSTVLPVAVALAGGERPGAGVYAGALLCLAAIVMASSAGDTGTSPRSGRATAPGRRTVPGRGRGIAYGIASGASFGLFFLLIRNAGQSGELWPVAAGRVGELMIVLIAAAAPRSASCWSRR